MNHFGLLTPFFVLCSLNQAAREVYYITTNSTDLCTIQPCLTLTQFAAYSSHYFHSNITLVFLPGTHHLTIVNLTLTNVDKFVMKSVANSTGARIQCTHGLSIHFNHIQYAHIANLQFIGCGGNEVKDVKKFAVEDTKFEGQENSGTALKLVETTAQIVNSIFQFNGRGSYSKCVNYIVSDPEYGCRSIGGAIIVTNSSIDISQSKFEGNRAGFGGAIFVEWHSSINLSGNVFVNNNAFEKGGALYSYSSNITIEASEFLHNRAFAQGGVLYSKSSTITIEKNEFHANSAFYCGGVLYSWRSNIIIEANKFHINSVNYWGGVVYSQNSSIRIEASEFHDNKADINGGVLSSDSSNITIEASEFYDNFAAHGGGVLNCSNSNITVGASGFHNNSAIWGGVLYSYSSIITFEGGVLNSGSSSIVIEASGFHNNNANHGGVLYSDSSTITIEASEFHNSSATYQGGVLYSSSSSITMSDSNFTDNSSPIGAVVFATDSSKIIYHHSSLLIENNLVDRYAVIYLSDSELSGNDSWSVMLFTNNLGSLMAFNSNITFFGYAKFVNNQPPPTATGDIQEGGAITLFQSNVFFDGACNLEHNHAENGGAIHSTESKLYVKGSITIAHNTASRNGGGVYLIASKLNFQLKSTFILISNAAVEKGGGLHAISSSIRASSSFSDPLYTGAKVNIIENSAKRGGGLSLEYNAKLYILKYDWIQSYFKYHYYNTITFTANSADYGGAVYVDDDTNSGTCASDTKTECFFQVLAIHGEEGLQLRTQSMYFSQNRASISGSTLYGGLLDRCSVSHFAEVYSKHFSTEQNYEYKSNGESYFKDISSGENTSISSLPVQVCLCASNEHLYNCTHHKHVETKKGQKFTLSVVAVDQVGQPVSATIQNFLHFTESGLAKGQLARKIPAKCTNLIFSIVSPHSSEKLTLYASDGPCKDAKLSRARVEIHFLPCSCLIGLQVSGINSTNCTCDCHSDIGQYMEHCDSHAGSLIKQPQSRAWISYINDTNLAAYLVYPNCPFDYCLSISPPVDLNQPDGADAQCAFNRSSLLCGSCQPGLSLSLGGSRCLQCPSNWPALLASITIAAIVAGIALVALLLVLNMTVAVGSLKWINILCQCCLCKQKYSTSFSGVKFYHCIYFTIEFGAWS